MNIRDQIRVIADDMEEGETRRQNHEDCPAGEDTKRRLYVTLKPEVAVGFCHNCQSSGSWYVGSTERYRPTYDTPSVVPVTAEYKYPTVTNWKEAPTDATIYRNQNKLSIETCKAFHVYYAPEHHAIHTPVRDMSGFITGHQLRPLIKGGGAKYITYLQDIDEQMGGYFNNHSAKSNVCVIVEDYISAIHVHEAGYAVLCNYGVQVKPDVLVKIPVGSDVIVWLDNDSEHVIEKAKDIQAVCQVLGYHTCRAGAVLHIEEPKKLKQAEIKEVVDGCLGL